MKFVNHGYQRKRRGTSKRLIQKIIAENSKISKKRCPSKYRKSLRHQEFMTKAFHTVE
jgi:hypothetical protein